MQITKTLNLFISLFALPISCSKLLKAFFKYLILFIDDKSNNLQKRLKIKSKI